MHVVMRDKLKTHTRFLFQPKAGTPYLETKSKTVGVPCTGCPGPTASAEERLRAGRVDRGPQKPREISPRCDFLLLPFFLPSFVVLSSLLLMPLQSTGKVSIVIKEPLATAFCYKELNNFSHSTIKLVAVVSSIRIHSSHSFILSTQLNIQVGRILRWPPRYRPPGLYTLSS